MIRSKLGLNGISLDWCLFSDGMVGDRGREISVLLLATARVVMWMLQVSNNMT
jgi:hypothetical protein